MANVIQAPSNFALAPDIQAQQLALSRQQQLADMLRQQGSTPIEQQTVTGAGPSRVVKISPWQAIAKVLQSGVGGYMQKGLDAKNLDLANQYNDRIGDMIGGGDSKPNYAQDPNGTNGPMPGQLGSGMMADAPPEQQAPPQSNSPMVNPMVAALRSGASGMPDSGSLGSGMAPDQGAPNMPPPTGGLPVVPQAGPVPQQNSTSSLNPIGMNNALAVQLLRNNPEKYFELQAAAYAPTDLQKNDRYLSITPEQSKVAEWAKRLKDGTQSMVPGQTNIVPGGKKIVAANFDNGVAGGYDANDMPIANEVPGSTAIAVKRAGDISAATEAPRLLPLGYKTPDGAPIGGTIGGYVNALRGTPAQSDNFTSGPQGLDLSKLPPLQVAALAKKDPEAFANGAADFQRTASLPVTQAPAVATPQLQSDSQAAQLAADVKLKNDPALTYANDASKALATKAESVGSQLNESQALLQRIEQSRDALTKFKAGGGAETRMQLAKFAQAIPGMPQSVVDGVAGGSLSAAQEFQKYAAQEALQTMQQSLANDSGKGSQGNRVSMQLFIKNNPNIDTDPNAIEKIFNFQTKLHNETLNKSDMLTKFIADPKTVKDPAVFDNMYAHSQINSGNVKPVMTQGAALGTTSSKPTFTNANAKTVTRTGMSNGRKVIQYSDGTIDYGN